MRYGSRSPTSDRSPEPDRPPFGPLACLLPLARIASIESSPRPSPDDPFGPLAQARPITGSPALVRAKGDQSPAASPARSSSTRPLVRSLQLDRALASVRTAPAPFRRAPFDLIDRPFSPRSLSFPPPPIAGITPLASFSPIASFSPTDRPLQPARRSFSPLARLPRTPRPPAKPLRPRRSLPNA